MAGPVSQIVLVSLTEKSGKTTVAASLKEGLRRRGIKAPPIIEAPALGCSELEEETLQDILAGRGDEDYLILVLRLGESDVGGNIESVLALNAALEKQRGRGLDLVVPTQVPAHSWEEFAPGLYDLAEQLGEERVADFIPY